MSNENLEMNTVFDNLESIEELGLFEEEDVQALNALFDLDDDSFKEIFPSFLSTLKENLNTPELRMLTLQTIKEDRLNRKDIENILEEIQIEIEKNEIFSDVKKEGLSLFFSTILGQCLDMLTEEELVIIPLEKENEEIKTPVYIHETDAGMDVYAAKDITISPGETKVINTGLKVAIPEGYAILVHPRSGLSARTKLRIANSIGLIDSAYKDSIGIILENIEPRIKDIESHYTEEGELIIDSIEYGSDFSIDKDMRIAQLRLVKVPKIIFKEVDSIQYIGEDRNGGIGSTGV